MRHNNHTEYNIHNYFTIFRSLHSCVHYGMLTARVASTDRVKRSLKNFNLFLFPPCSLYLHNADSKRQ